MAINYENIPDGDKKVLSDLGFEVKEFIGSGVFGFVFRGVCTAQAERTYVLNEYEFNANTDRIIEVKDESNRKIKVYLRDVKLEGRECAIKMIPHNRKYYEEAKNLMSLRHPNVADVYGVLRNRDNGNVYIISEYMSGGKVLQLMKGTRLEERICLEAIKQLANGLYYMHSQGVTHGDLMNPGNIVFQTTTNEETGQSLMDYTFKYIDFGSSDRPESDPQIKDDPELWNERFQSDIQGLAFIWEKLTRNTNFVTRSIAMGLGPLIDKMSFGEYLQMEDVLRDLDQLHPGFFPTFDLY